MSMAVVCARLNWMSPSAFASKTETRSFSNVPSSTARSIFQLPQWCGDRKRYTSLVCQASSGGSRRDYEKILARKTNRRVRHMKGVTPSTPDLIQTLDSETRDQAKLDSERPSDDDEYDFEDNAMDKQEFEDPDTPDVRPA